MEELRKLEQVQRTLKFMESRAISTSSDPDSSRFLANLILLLAQPCGELDMDSKCTLVYTHMPKISVAFLEEAKLLITQESITEAEDERNGPFQNVVDNSMQLDCENETYSGMLQTNFEGTAMVGLDAMQRANSTLEDFLDSLNEKMLHLPTSEASVSERGCKDGHQRLITHFTDAFKRDPFRPLVGLLECLGILTERIRDELKCGEEYWALERKLCCALMSQEKISVEDVIRAIHLKSFDYRVLNLLLYQLRGEKVNDLHMEFLCVSEFLVEVSDDLFDYEDDVLENSFNVLRMFVRIYGASRAPIMLARYITEAEQKYESLLKTLDPQLSLNYQKRCEEATKEGGKISGHILGMWSIPPVIVDEELYRSNFQNSK
ncbi:uncharacterized protein LOC142623830 isoform X4 [Castanea sativa]|uniref:uncharacterized protein LOC142623830 isoform X4 n=1 Tax=Castanea sativa TaxID=21020 RepID=UPI003F650ACD